MKKKFLLKNVECISYIKTMKNKFSEPFIDAIITDPPYNISQKNNFKTMGRAGIDFAKWDHDFDQTTWIKEFAPIVKKDGTIIIFNAWRNLGTIAKTLEESGFEVKDIIRWIKNNPMPRNIERRYVIDYEFAIWAVKKGAKWTFNKNSDTYARPEYKYPLVPKSDIKIHPTQKPVKLMEEIILRHTNPKDLILDPFAGSGSTGVAALSNDRFFMGLEVDKTFYDFANKWLEKVVN